jgi:chloramphenicol-sensitive protein RarD
MIRAVAAPDKSLARRPDNDRLPAVWRAPAPSSMPTGLLYAALAFFAWGLFPLFFRQMASVAPLDIVLVRSVGLLVFMLLVLGALRRFAWLGAMLRQPRQLALFGVSAVLLAGNWLLYVWAVNGHRVVDASLGYFINPLVNVLLGFVVLHERLRRGQWLAVALAAAGVAWLTVQAGQLPWIALVLAISFGLYGLLRKTATLGSLEGLALEVLLLAPLALPWLAWRLHQGQGGLGADMVTLGWLALAGPLTALTLLLFAAGARRLPMSTLGLLQYISPSLQFGLGVWLFHEPFDAARFTGFVLIWAALACYAAEGGWRARRRRGDAPASLPT